MAKDHLSDPLTRSRERDTWNRNPFKIYYDEANAIGNGHFGSVYAGKLEDKEVAVKVISTVSKGSKTAIGEIKMLFLCGAKSHPNVLQYYHVEIQNNNVVLALELCQANLKEWVATKGACILPGIICEEQVCSQIVKGMGYLHKRNIIHRDLKPENILFATSSSAVNGINAKIADFGLCKIMSNAATSFTMSKASGTPGWMAPEILRFLEEEEEKAGKSKPSVPIKTVC